MFATGFLLLPDRVTEAPVLSRRLVSRSLRRAPGGTGPGRRRWLYAAVSAIALAGAAAAVPILPAAADPGTINFMAVSGNGSGNLSVTVTSDDQLTGITVHLWSGGSDTGTDVLDLTDFAELDTFSPGATQTWTLGNPAKDLAKLPPGAYTATADATDVAVPADTVTDQPLTGKFSYLAQPTLTLSSITSTRPNQSVAVTGQVTGCVALSCPTNWPIGTPVIVSDVTSTSQPTWQGATTDQGGDFSVPGVTAVPGDSYVASVPATSTNVAGTSAAVQDAAQYATTSITATATAAPFGHQTISGTLTYQSGLNQIPAPSGVSITFTAQGQSPITTTTDADGTFSQMLPPVSGTTAWTLSSQANDQATNPFLAGTQVSINATQTQWLASIGTFSATINRDYFLTVKGCMTTTTQPAPPADFPAIQLQYELTKAGPWKTIGTISTTPPLSGCKGVSFLAGGVTLIPSAYYRAVSTADDIYTSATSSRVKAGLIATRFTAFKASPKTVAAGKKVKISGTLQYHTNKWHGYARQRVLLIFAKHENAKRYFAFKWLTTGKNGTFSDTFTYNLGTMWWSANYNGNSTHFIAGAIPVHVTMRGRAVRHIAATQSITHGQTAASLFETMHGPAGWGRFGWPFMMAADPLLIMMGTQA
jgi:hypothetical protein